MKKSNKKGKKGEARRIILIWLVSEGAEKVKGIGL